MRYDRFCSASGTFAEANVNNFDAVRYVPLAPEIKISYLILSYLILSYLYLSYLILSYLILSYLILSYLILSYLIALICREYGLKLFHI